MWWHTLSVLALIIMLTIGILLIHHDGVMVGEERAYARLERARRAERRMCEAHARITSSNTSTTTDWN